MAETEVRTDGIDQLLRSWDALLKAFPAMKAELLDKMGQQMLSDVQQEIGGRGNVAGWQARHVGSKLGYVAVRPKANTYQTTQSGKRYAVGYVTNAIENGHRNRKPQPTNREGYHYTQGRNKTAAAAGRHFYAAVRGRLGTFGKAELERLAAEIARRLEGAA